MNENLFRGLAGGILFTCVGISSHFRRKADAAGGGAISRRVDGSAMMTAIKVGGLVLWLSPLVYLVNPSWMAWSRLGLPDWARWLGVAVGLLCVGLIYWLFSSIGSGISPTSATRERHVLVTRGPYRWVRHPLYTVGSAMFVAFGLMADSWFIAALGLLAFVMMAIRTPREEANLIARFGDDYIAYMKRTGRFFPRLF